MKRIISLLLSIAFSTILVFGTNIMTVNCAGGDEIRASKKIISVVYDDSGSMEGERWSYTDYAMQALIALLNEQDELYITFMSSPGKAVKMDTSDLEGTIKTIRDWSDTGGTPGEALDTARDQLDSVSESDGSAQFWMIILTDGAISMKSTLQNKLDSYKHNTMSNGTLLNVVYMGMGGAVEANEDVPNHLHTFDADDDDEIVESLQRVANLVSGRLSPDDVKQIDKNTISVSSKLPLYSLSILSQKSDATVTKAVSSEEELNVQRNLSLDATDLRPYGVEIKTLYGNAAVINRKNSSGDMEVIGADTYTITFSSDVDIDNMTIQVEPAIALKAEISRNGVVIDDTSKLENGDQVDINIIPVVPGTDDVIPDSDLPKQISWEIEYEVDGSMADSGSGRSLKGVTLSKGSNVIRGIINIPGYAPFVSEVYFNIAEIIHNFGIEVDNQSGLSYYRKDLNKLKLDSSNSIVFRITDNGAALSKDELKGLGLSLKIDDISVVPLEEGDFLATFGNVNVGAKLKQNDDGSYSLIPTYPAGLFVIFLNAGDYTVRVCIAPEGTVTETAEFSIIPSTDDPNDIPPKIIGLLLILYLMYLLFIKHKFKGQVVHAECWKIADEDGNGLEIKSLSDSKTLGFFSGGFLLPTRSCSVNYHGLRLVADSDGTVRIPSRSIIKTVAKYGTSTREPKTQLLSLDKELVSVLKDNDKREATEHYLSNNYFYFKTSVDSKNIWRIWMTEE